LIVEAGTAVPWTQPADLSYAPDRPIPALGGLFTGGSWVRDRLEPDGFNVALADGSVRFLPRGRLDERTLRGLITRSGGEDVSPP
jgi:prepilin-type processing-associated H-X9-DG protein